MSRKDYIAIAAAIRAEVDGVSPEAHHGGMGPTAAAYVRETLRGVAAKIATYAETENTRFDRTRFLDACGLL